MKFIYSVKRQDVLQVMLNRGINPVFECLRSLWDKLECNPSLKTILGLMGIIGYYILFVKINSFSEGIRLFSAKHVTIIIM